MTRLLLPIILVFVFLPYDAQLWLLGLGRSIPAEFWFGAVGATMMGAIFYSLGWNGLAAQLHNEDTARADDSYRKRRRGL